MPYRMMEMLPARNALALAASLCLPARSCLAVAGGAGGGGSAVATKYSQLISPDKL